MPDKLPIQPKTQRWADLLAALLRYQRSGVTLQQLRRDVPGYFAGGSDATVARMFERDKAELRELGVHITSIEELDGSINRYRLTARDFYLPYLRLADGSALPRRVNGDGYRSLDEITFTPDEIAAIVRGVARLTQLGDGAVAHEARMALRRLAHDLPVDQTLTARELVVAESPLDAKLFDELVEAVRKRKSLRFTYHAFNSDRVSERHVDPYGVAHINGHWYLVGRDVGADGIRQFRLRRMRELSVNKQRPGTHDFAPPADFDLWAHTRSRQAWELGDAEATDITVLFNAETGVTAPAIALGEAAPDDALRRRYRVRRPEVFLRWVLGFGGAARVVAPSSTRADFTALVQETYRLYAREILL